jgi:hypothetical protein
MVKSVTIQPGPSPGPYASVPGPAFKGQCLCRRNFPSRARVLKLAVRGYWLSTKQLIQFRLTHRVRSTVTLESTANHESVTSTWRVGMCQAMLARFQMTCRHRKMKSSSFD